MLADKGYDGDRFREAVVAERERSGHPTQVKPPPGRRQAIACDVRA